MVFGLRSFFGPLAIIVLITFSNPRVGQALAFAFKAPNRRSSQTCWRSIYSEGLFSMSSTTKEAEAEADDVNAWHQMWAEGE
jgi:hypothetical protein